MLKTTSRHPNIAAITLYENVPLGSTRDSPNKQSRLAGRHLHANGKTKVSSARDRDLVPLLDLVLVSQSSLYNFSHEP